jgi:hypothetical protein
MGLHVTILTVHFVENKMDEDELGTRSRLDGMSDEGVRKGSEAEL